MAAKKENSMTVNLYCRRTGGRPPVNAPFSVSHDVNEDIDLGSGSETLSLYKHENIHLMGFKSTIKAGEHLIAAAAQIPSYFDEFPDAYRRQGPFCGILMTKIMVDFEKKSKTKIDPQSAFASFMDPSCKGKGSEDCPYYIQLSGESTRGKKERLSHFTFNGQVFFPLLMRAFTIAYFVADESSIRYNWDHPDYRGIKPPGGGLVAVNSPIRFDPTLGIFVTRNAELVDA